MQNHYFDNTHPLRPYTHSLPAMPGTFPPANALRGEDAPAARPGFHPAENGGVWIEIEDHRGKEGYVNGEPSTVKDYGPLPEGWSDTPPPLTLEEARAAKIAEINTGYASVLGYIRAGYPPDEVQTWTMQAEQARELAENPEAQALFVRYLAAVKGVEADEMARRILVNAQNWEPVAGMLTAQRQLMEEASWAAATVGEIEAIKVSYSA